MATATERQRDQVAAYQAALGALRDFRPNVFQGFRAEEKVDEPEGSYGLIYHRALHRLRDQYPNKFDRLYRSELAKRGLVTV